jgi:hypothetical protein
VKYRRKPEISNIVESIQLKPDNILEVYEFCHPEELKVHLPNTISCDMWEKYCDIVLNKGMTFSSCGYMTVAVIGDYIIKDVNGELSKMPSELFEKYFEPSTEMHLEVKYRTALIGLELVKKEVENPVSIAMIDEAIKYIKKHGNNPMIGIQDANHFRNTYYNAPIGTLENQIANELDRHTKLKSDIKRYIELRNTNKDIYAMSDVATYYALTKEQRNLEEKLKKVE